MSGRTFNHITNGMKVDEATFVVTDVETTGTSVDSDRIIEIGAVKVRGGEVIDQFQQLINPQRSIPGRIARLTGITTSMVFDAPPAEKVLPAYLDFLGEGIFVAHNRSFDEDFFTAELERLERAPLENKSLCTLRLARRLLPGLDSKGLSRLVQFYDIDVEGRHRALGDAAATSIVLRRLLRQLAFEYDAETLEQVLSFQYQSYQGSRETPTRLDRIRNEVLPNVPDSPGVYAFTSDSGTPLYIGKAKCLSDRLRSHFTAVESKSGRKRKMLQKVHAVNWETATTELQALLRESRRIKAQKPRYNRAQRRYYNRPFIRFDTTHEYPTISWARSLSDDGAEYYGPVRNADQAEMVVDVVGRCFELRECDDERLHLGQRCLYADMDRCVAPCEEGNPEAYAEVVERVRTFLEGRDPTVLAQLRDRMHQASNQHDFERAAEFRDTVEQLEGILEKQRIPSGPVRRHNAALVHAENGREGQVDVLFVRFGQFEGALSMTLPFEAGHRAHLLDRCRTLFDSSDPPPASLSKQETTEIRLLLQWICAHRDELSQVRWTPGRSPASMAEAIHSRISDSEGVLGQPSC